MGWPMRLRFSHDKGDIHSSFRAAYGVFAMITTKNGSSEKLLPPLKREPQTENAVKVNKRAKGQTLFGE